MTTLVALLGCNLGAAPYPDPTIAPGGRAPWSHPTETACAQRDDPDAFEVDGYTFCAFEEGLTKIPVDDPVLVPCSEISGQTSDVVALFDGVEARAYPVGLLRGRELVNDLWGDEPILVDY